MTRRALSTKRKVVTERARRAKARLRGICQDCVKRHARPGRSTCSPCAEERKKVRRRHLKLCAAQGLCTRCPVKAPKPRTIGPLCADCHAKKKAFPSAGKNVTKERRTTDNLCIEGCDRIATRGQKCEECASLARDSDKARREERLVKGLCYRCGKYKAKPNRSCSYCRRKRRVTVDRRTGRKVADGRCTRCGSMGHRKNARRCPMWRASMG